LVALSTRGDEILNSCEIAGGLTVPHDGIEMIPFGGGVSAIDAAEIICIQLKYGEGVG